MFAHSSYHRGKKKKLWILSDSQDKKTMYDIKKWLCVCKEVIHDIMLTPCCVVLNAREASNMQLTCGTGQDTDPWRKDWWENVDLKESLEPSAMSSWGELALGGPVVPIDLMPGVEGGQAVGKESPVAATLILRDWCTWDHLAEFIQRGC